MVASSILVVMLMLYLIPVVDDTVDLNKKQVLEYVYPNNLEAIYLLDINNNLTRSMIGVNNESILTKATSLIEELTIDGKKKDIIPNQFK